MGKPITEAMKKIYEKMEWKYHVIPGADRLVIGFPANEELGMMIWNFDEDRETGKMFVQFEKKVSSEARTDVLEFLNMSNAMIKFGHFFIDLSDGEVNFKVNMNKFENVDYDEVATYLFGVTHSAMSMFLDPLGEVIAGTKTPNEAIDALKGK